MGSNKGQIGLHLAERSKPGKGSFDYRSSATQRWVAELPVGNIGETAKQLFGTLQEVNRLDIAWKDRMAFLELLREPVSYVQASLIRHYTGMSFPLPPKTQRVATLAQTLYSEMALGYKTAIEDMQAGNFLTRDNKALTLLVHRAIRYLSQAVITCYQIYAPHPEHSWLELHRLYLFALEKKIQQDAVHDELNTHMPKTSIARAYKQILLLALASPYRLRQGEAEAIYTVLVRWGGHVEILPYDHPEANEALFVVHTDSDEAPDYQAFNRRNCDSSHCSLVDTRQLSKVLQEEYQQLKEARSKAPLSAELLFRLICAWGQAPKRQFSRTNRQSTMEVVVGTAMLHHALANELGDAAMQGKRSSFESRVVTPADQPRDDIWNIFASNKLKKAYETYSQAFESSKADEPKPPVPLQIQHWQLRNESAGGYRLSLGDEQECKVQVGELVGMRPLTSKQAWEIGVVRWLRQSSELGLEIGLQILAPQARPAMVKNEKAGGRAAEFQYALLLPELPSIKQPASIVTPILLFQPGNELLLHIPGHHITLRLEESLQDSGSFIQFRYSYLQDDAQQDSTQAARDLDDLWDSL